MPSLLEIRNQIDATKGTKKITKAMQLVAASKMKSFQKTAESVNEYTFKLLNAVLLSGGSMKETPFGEVRDSGKMLFVLMTSDKGLCGAMNNRLIRKTFRSNLWKNTPESERLLITVGRKSAEAARIAGYETVAEFAGLKDKLETFDALEVIDAILTQWKTGEVKKVVLIAPEYVNPFVFNIRKRDYLPLTPESVVSLLGDGDESFEDVSTEAAFFEPSQEAAVLALAQQVVESLFLEAFFELKATEYSSRMVAMKQATEAADDKIKELTNAFNKARQRSITRQLSELASANEAMSSEQLYESFEV